MTRLIAGIGTAEFELFGGSYRLSRRGLAWREALSSCQASGMSLATIYSADHNTRINEEVRKYVNSSARLWIGANDVEQEGQWSWVGTTALKPPSGVSGAWSPWAAGSPNNGNGGAEHCAAVGTAGEPDAWDDWPCSSQFPYLCAAAGGWSLWVQSRPLSCLASFLLLRWCSAVQCLVSPSLPIHSPCNPSAWPFCAKSCPHAISPF